MRVLRLRTGDESVKELQTNQGMWEDGGSTVRVSKMNTGLVGKMFGGNIARVMGGHVAEDERRILSEVVVE